MDYHVTVRNHSNDVLRKGTALVRYLPGAIETLQSSEKHGGIQTRDIADRRIGWRCAGLGLDFRLDFLLHGHSGLCHDSLK